MDNYSTGELIRARREIVKFGETENLWLEGYELPDGEIRYAPTAISLFLGKGVNYVLQSRKAERKTLKAWRKEGFNGHEIQVTIAERKPGVRGASLSTTISGNDLDAIVRAEANRKNKIAIALLSASFTEVRTNRENSAFGRLQPTLEENQAEFSESFGGLTNEDYVAECRELREEQADLYSWTGHRSSEAIALEAYERLCDND